MEQKKQSKLTLPALSIHTMNKSYFKNKSRGLTLVEVVAAIFVLTVGLLSVTQLYPIGYILKKQSKNLTVASSLAQGKLEEMISKNYEEISEVSKQKVDIDTSSPFNRYDWQAQVAYVNPASNMDVAESDLGIKKITVTIYWIENEQEKTLVAYTLAAQK